MKSISSQLDQHLQGGSNTLSRCWLVTRTDGQQFGFTESDTPIYYNGVFYEATSGMTPSALTEEASLAVGNMNMSGFLSSPSITIADLQAGVWDWAELRTFLLNRRDLTMGELKLMKGHFGQFQAGRTSWTAELRSLVQAYSRNIGEIYSPGCRADLGDARCKVNLAPFTFTGTVTAISADNLTITSGLTNANGYFNFGKLTFTSGLNNTLSMEVKTYTVGVLVTQLPMPYSINVGDTFSVYAGCDKSKATCINKFANIVNMRAEPDLPGQDKVLQVGGR